jgi:hypothetical protein
MAAIRRVLAALFAVSLLDNPLGLKSQAQGFGSHAKRLVDPVVSRGIGRRASQGSLRALLARASADYDAERQSTVLQNEVGSQNKAASRGNQGVRVMMRLRGGTDKRGIDSLLEGDKADRMRKIDEYLQESMRREKEEKAAEDAFDRALMNYTGQAWDNMSGSLNFYTTEGDLPVWHTPEEKVKFENATCIDPWQDELFRSSWANYKDRYQQGPQQNTPNKKLSILSKCAVFLCVAAMHVCASLYCFFFFVHGCW